jgi:hypothetical protein
VNTVRISVTQCEPAVLRARSTAMDCRNTAMDPKDLILERLTMAAKKNGGPMRGARLCEWINEFAPVYALEWGSSNTSTEMLLSPGVDDNRSRDPASLGTRLPLSSLFAGHTFYRFRLREILAACAKALGDKALRENFTPKVMLPRLAQVPYGYAVLCGPPHEAAVAIGFLAVACAAHAIAAEGREQEVMSIQESGLFDYNFLFVQGETSVLTMDHAFLKLDEAHEQAELVRKPDDLEFLRVLSLLRAQDGTTSIEDAVLMWENAKRGCFVSTRS